MLYNIHMLRNTFLITPELETPAAQTAISQEASELDANTVELPIDLFLEGDNIIVRTPVVAAGINDVSVSIVGDELTITKAGSLSSDSADEYYIKECYWDRLSRNVILPKPVDVERTRATLNDGVLTITLPLLHKPSSKVIRVK